MKFKDVVEKLKTMKVEKLFVQYPEGMKLKIVDISKNLEKEGFEIIISMEPC